MKYLLFVSLYMASSLSTSLADDLAVKECRATEGERQLAGECGAHGCDCGVLRSECGETLRWLKANRPSQGGRAWMEADAAYKTNCTVLPKEK